MYMQTHVTSHAWTHISLSEVLKVWGTLQMTVSLPCLSPHLPDPTVWQAMDTSAFMHTEGFLLQRKTPGNKADTVD